MNFYKMRFLLLIKKMCEVFGLRSFRVYRFCLERLPSRSPAFTDFPGMTIRIQKNITVPEIQKHKNKKIMIFGIPKSGNVWLLNLLQEITGLESQVSFTHQPFSSQRFDRNIFRAVCIVRDLRDVVASYYRFTKRKGNRNNTTAYFDSADEFYYKYFLTMLKSAQNDIELSLPDALADFGVPIVKYEDLLHNPVQEIIKLFQQWKLVDIDQYVIEKAARKYEVSSEKQPQYRTTEHIFHDHAQFVEKKGYKDVLSPNALRHIEKYFGEHLERWGYHLESQSSFNLLDSHATVRE